MEPRFKPLYKLLRQTAETIILPRFKNLGSDEIEEKRPGDRVTIADKEAEHHLIAGLKAMGTDALFLGEESTAENPKLLELVDQIKTPYWVLDPIDGTQNFIEGKTTFCTMIALVQQGLPVLSMIYFPLTDTLFAAELGRGAFRFEKGGQGERLKAGQSPELFNMSGALNTHYTDEDLTDRLNHLADRVEKLKSERCAGVEYSLLAQGQKDFANFQYLGVEMYYEFLNNLKFFDKLSQEHNLDFLVKPHPSENRCLDDLKKTFKNLKFTQKKIDVVLKNVFVTISFSSTVIEDSLYSNVPVILFDNSYPLLNPSSKDFFKVNDPFADPIVLSFWRD